MGVTTGSHDADGELIGAMHTRNFKAAAATTSVHLFKTDVTPSDISVIGDFTEADFTGYAAQTIAAWDASQIDALTGRKFMTPTLGTPAIFTQTGVVLTNTVYGFWLEDNGALFFAERFENPVQMDTLGKTVTILPRVFPQPLFGPDALED